ncbi:riboflavin synthase [bacterium]|nr:riboflavin synthase [bacterium]
MFTGLIRSTGLLREREGKHIWIECAAASMQLSIGDSVAVNGVCLTVARLTDEGWGADLLDETLSITSLGKLPIGCRLNLEPAMRLGDSLGGHMLSGHVECHGSVVSKVWRNGGDCALTVAIPATLNTYMMHKGSIAIDGVSLTIQEVDGNNVRVELIPETLAATNLAAINEGDPVNIEPDMLMKSVHHSVEMILAAREKRTEQE